MSFQLVSNLTKLPKASAPILAILGNCSIPTLFSATQHWDHVYLVPGIQDISSSRKAIYTTKMDTLYHIAKQTQNLSILEHGTIEIPKSPFVLLGTPLHSDKAFTDTHPIPYMYESVYTHKGLVTALDIAEWHWQDRDWLKGQLCWYKRHKPTSKLICFTHTNPFHTTLRNVILKNPSLIHGWYWAGRGKESTVDQIWKGTRIGEIGSEGHMLSLRDS